MPATSYQPSHVCLNEALELHPTVSESKQQTAGPVLANTTGTRDAVAHGMASLYLQRQHRVHSRYQDHHTNDPRACIWGRRVTVTSRSSFRWLESLVRICRKGFASRVLESQAVISRQDSSWSCHPRHAWRLLWARPTVEGARKFPVPLGDTTAPEDMIALLRTRQLPK